MPDFGNGFVGPDRIVALSLHKSGPDRFDLFDSDCRVTGTWEVEGGWSISDVSAERGLVSAVRGDRVGVLRQPTDLVVIDPLTRKIVQRWPTERA